MLESQVRELQARLDEAENSSRAGGKRVAQQLENRVRELEVELDEEQRRHTDTAKGSSKKDVRVKELAFQVEEDRKAKGRLQTMIHSLQEKVKTYKRQVEEAEETAAINLAKYRKVASSLEESEERAELAESTMNKMRQSSRSRTSVKIVSN